MKLELVSTLSLELQLTLLAFKIPFICVGSTAVGLMKGKYDFSAVELPQQSWDYKKGHGKGKGKPWGGAKTMNNAGKGWYKGKMGKWNAAHTWKQKPREEGGKQNYEDQDWSSESGLWKTTGKGKHPQEACTETWSTREYGGLQLDPNHTSPQGQPGVDF